MKEETDKRNMEKAVRILLAITVILTTLYVAWINWANWERYQSIKQLKIEVYAAKKECEERVEKNRKALEECREDQHVDAGLVDGGKPSAAVE
jgi:hypothetical protein